MGNPHPTKSKPVKVGRKHTGAPSLRALGRHCSAELKARRQQSGRWRAFKNEAAAYWRGELDHYPLKP